MRLSGNHLYPKALDEFLKLPPDVPFAHQQPEDGLLSSVSMPELSQLRDAARFLALKIIVEAENQPRVREYSRNLTGIRDRLLKSNYLTAIWWRLPWKAPGWMRWKWS